MTGLIIFIEVLALAATAFGQPNATETYSNTMTLKNDAFILYWKFTSSEITFEIHAKTGGWVGLGVSENANMIGADIMVGWVKNGIATITDRHGDTQNTFPPNDSQQDVNLLFGSECDGWTIIKYLRQLGACESSSDREITSSATRLIWAFGESDPTGDDIVGSDVHLTTDRGSTSVYLLEAQARSALPEGKTYLTANLTSSNFAIPTSNTHYSCLLFKLDPTEKSHIVKVAPIITEANKANVHHILMYSCGRSIPDENEVGVTATCFTSNMAYLASCSTVMAAWAIGGSEIVYSDVAGLPIGGTEDPIYFQIEIHYDNPSGTSGLVDNSGLQLTYTSDLLPNDLGILQIGNVVSGLVNFAPPRATEFLSFGVCGGNCISDAMTNAEVTEMTMVGSLLHSHLAGRKLKLRHIRGGVEQEPIFDDSYDFNYQEARVLDPPRTVQSGDTFRMECTYNTETRTQMTLHGLGTLNEMCLVFLLYYPKIDVAKCESYPNPVVPYGYVGIAQADATGASSIYDVSVQQPSSLAGKSVGEVMDEVAWTDVKASELSQASLGTTQVQRCQKQDLSNVQGESLNVPSITTEYVIESKTCTTPATPYDQSKMTDTCPSNGADSASIPDARVILHAASTAFLLKTIWL